MTLTDFIPGLKGTGSRRAGDKIAELRDENRKLLTRQMAADEYFALLMQDRDEVYAAWQQEKKARLLLEDINCSLRSEVDGWQELVDDLRAQLAPFLAAEANANRVDVPPMVRDTTAMEDQATGPIDVTTLWAARDAGLLGPVTDPGHVHAH